MGGAEHSRRVFSEFNRIIKASGGMQIQRLYYLIGIVFKEGIIDV